MTHYFREQQAVSSELVLDRGLLYGDSVFTSIALKAGQLLLLDEHIARLAKDAQRLNFAEYDFTQLKAQLQTLYANHQADGVVRLALSRGSGERGYAYSNELKPVLWHSYSPWPKHVEHKRLHGIQAIICHSQLSQNPQLAGIKHGNRLEQIMARAEWSDPNISEGLMLDQSQHVIEGTMSNLFIISDGQFITPELTQSGVDGIMRAQVIQAINSLGYQVQEAQVSKSQLFEAEALFVSNSVIGIWPIIKLEQQNFAYHPTMSKLLEQLQTAQAI